MQKKIIALAVAAAASGAAFAQTTNVTMYGIMDVYGAYVDPKGASSYTAIQSGGLNASRIGIRVNEDLGNGLRAYANVEAGITADAGAAANAAFGGNARQSYVGLAGSFGAVQFGTQSTLSDAWSGQYDYAADFSAKSFAGRAGASSGIAKVGNSFAYLSPSFGGATIGFAHVADEKAGAGESKSTNQLGVNYANGPLALTYVYSKNGSDADHKGGNFLGARYNFGVATVMAEYTNKIEDGQNPRFYQLGAVVPVGKGNVHVGFGEGRYDSSAKFRSTVVAYTHGLSARTTAYTGWVHNSGDQADFDFDTDLKPAGIAGKGNIVVVGLRHTF